MIDTKTFFNKIFYGGGVVFDLLKWVILTIVITILIFNFLISIFIVDGLSMEPALYDNEWVLLQKNAFNTNQPKRGDVVVVHYPGDPAHTKYVKRIVGLPGEKIQIKEGAVYINDKLFLEEYLPINVATHPSKEWRISSGKYFLMGDNRSDSNDSRYFGPVEERFLYGKAIRIIYPRFRSITSQ